MSPSPRKLPVLGLGLGVAIIAAGEAMGESWHRYTPTIGIGVPILFHLLKAIFDVDRLGDSTRSELAALRAELAELKKGRAP
jgi:hypothetical protein